ncbi:MAG: archaemetzincin family Zn-dependent metalloprotease [Nitrospiraceae bacterium]|nr:archaemetzincin family Zn-dependent metalloprotease [Nitrospiraceae bacterium]
MTWYGEAEKIYILPFGKLPDALLETIKDSVRERFGKETAIADAASLPLYSYDRSRHQCNSTAILEGIARMGLEGMALGAIDADLYASALNFVFGEADPVEGAAIISIARLREEFYGRTPDWPLLLERAVKESVHETGHLYGLSHCPDARCVMHFSNSLDDTDLKSSRFCPSCRTKLESTQR